MKKWSKVWLPSIYTMGILCPKCQPTKNLGFTVEEKRRISTQSPDRCVRCNMSEKEQLLLSTVNKQTINRQIFAGHRYSRTTDTLSVLPKCVVRHLNG